MKGRLIQELGQRYVDDMWRDALFVYDDRVHTYIGAESDSSIATKWVKLDGSSAKFSRGSVPASVFESMSTFAWPKLGYRNFRSKEHGHLVYYLTSTRSALRGLRESQITFDSVPVHMINPYTNEARHALKSHEWLPEVFKPTFPALPEAVSLLTSGERGAVALSEDLAIGVSCTVAPDRAFDVYFKQRLIGSMNTDGVIEIANKIIRRGSTAKLLSKGGLTQCQTT